MKILFKIILTIWLLAQFFTSSAAQAVELGGQWQGKLRVSEAVSIEMMFNFVRQGETYTVTLDVPAQQQFGIPFDKVKVSASAIELALTAAGISYKGEVDNDVIVGTYIQSGALFSLEMRKVLKDVTQLNVKPKKRPQDPVANAKYRVEEVTFTNPNGGHELAGSLALPNQKAAYAIILLSGSGPSTRDADAFGHKSFLVLSDLLARQGIAVLRFDDRGVGKSTGNHQLATSLDFATDASAAVTFIRQHKELSLSKVGFAGHSEGGLIATVAAANGADIDFIVSLAGPGTSGQQILVDQSYEIQRLMGVPKEALAQSDKIQKQILRAVAQDKSHTELRQMMLAAGMSQQQVSQQLTQISTPWFRTFVKTDPAPYMQKVQVPVLALNGGKDVQVLAQPNIAGFKKHLRPNLLTAKIYDNLNHLFQPATTGLPNEYAQIRTTFSPQVAEDIVAWIKAINE